MRTEALIGTFVLLFGAVLGAVYAQGEKNEDDVQELKTSIQLIQRGMDQQQDYNRDVSEILERVTRPTPRERDG